MSKAKDRQRAELGEIFRDGRLVNKAEWYALHPPLVIETSQQQGVDKAVQTHLGSLCVE